MTDTDITERLREVADIKTGALYSRRLMLNDAAAEIERLRAEVEALEANASHAYAEGHCAGTAAAMERAAQIAESLPRITDLGGGLYKHTDHKDAARAIRQAGKDGGET